MLERWTESNRDLKENPPSQSCDNLIVYEAVEIKIVSRIPVRHGGVAHDDGIEHHGVLIEVSKRVESVHGLAEVDRVVHDH